MSYELYNGSETITIKYFSMFSGIGGFEYGLQQSKYDFENVGFSEIDKYAVSIYERHYPNHTNYGDATKIKTEELPDFDFLVGGFPCQAFSVAGKRGGFNDTRGTLFFEIARILKDKKPPYFLLENVRGLLSHDKGRTFKTILGILSDLGYIVQWTLLNSADFQVPQRRERVFIEGYLGGESTGEVLSVRRNCSKNITKVNSYRDKHRTFSVYPDTNTVTRALTAVGQNGGGVKLSLNPPVDNKGRAVKKVGNFSPSGHYGKNVYADDGLCPTFCSGSVVKNGLNIRESKS